MAKEAKVCKACAKDIPELEGIHYCPYCGISLQDIVAQAAEISGKEEEVLLAEVD